MKKILGALVLIVLAAAVFVAYQWRLASDRLAQAARGGTYRSLGIKLEIAPGQGGIQGMFRLKPYINIPQVVLDLSAWGLAGQVPLGSARLSTRLWEKTGLLLVLEPGGLQRDGFTAKRLAFELAIPDVLLGLRSEALIFSNTKTGESVTLEEPWLQFGATELPIPAQLNFRLQALRYAKGGPASGSEEIHLGSIEAGYSSEPKGGDRAWSFFYRGQGGGFRFAKGQGEIFPWNYQARGSFAEIPLERWKRLAQQWISAAESRPMAESQPTTDPWQRLSPLLQSSAAFLVEWRPQLDAMEFHWAGLKVGDEAKQKVVAIDPLDFQVSYAEASEGLKIEANGTLKKIEAAILEHRFEAADLSFSQKSLHKGLRYRDWLGYFSRYYSATFSLPSDPKQIVERLSTLYRSYLAQLPDEVNGEFKLRHLVYKNPRYQTEHREASTTYMMNQGAWDFRLRDDFDSILTGDPAKSIQQGKIDLDFAFKLPWGEVLRAMRLPETVGESAPHLLQIFSGRPVGLDWKWLVDFGPNLFGLRVNMKMGGDAAKILGAGPIALSEVSHRLAAAKMAQDAFRAFLATGSLDLNLQIDRLSKLQATMEKVQSGSSLGLAILGPYVEVDAKGDAMKAHLNVTQGEVLLNGRKNPTVETFLREALQ